jgi:N-glycosylase/DNA lyase
MNRAQDPLTIRHLLRSYEEKRETIQSRLREFEALGREADDERYLEELAFCIFAAGTSARHGMQCVERVRPFLFTGNREELREVLRGQRFYNLRSGFLYQTREYLKETLNLELKNHIHSFHDPQSRRDFLALNPNIAGIGMKEASHYLRNVGFKGYAILDKHILRGLHELGAIESSSAPNRPDRYREIEGRLHAFSGKIGIDVDELDLLLWSERTGEILK